MLGAVSKILYWLWVHAGGAGGVCFPRFYSFLFFKGKLCAKAFTQRAQSASEKPLPVLCFEPPCPELVVHIGFQLRAERRGR